MNRQTILCVDDESFVLESLKAELKEALGDQYVIETADSGEDALEVVQELIDDQGELPLVVSDYIMPNIKGDELLRRIHTLSPQTLKILLTGQATIEGVTNALNAADLYRYIAKPWDPRDLIMTIRQAIRSYNQDKYLKQVLQSYEQFVPKKFLKFLDRESIVDVRLGDQILKEMTVMFSDIRSYTALSETMTPQENFEFLNGYLRRMSPHIADHGGIINQYLGDGIMALFPEQPDDALRSAIQMQQEVRRYSRERQHKGRRPIQIGIGIHSGLLILGILGDEARKNTNVVSDDVNLASRMEGLAKMYGTSILISDQMRSRLVDSTRYQLRFLGKAKVFGKEEPVSVFEVLDGDPQEVQSLKQATAADFERAIELYYQRDFARAASCFLGVGEQNPEDKVCQLYLKRSRYLASNASIADWEEVETMGRRWL